MSNSHYDVIVIGGGTSGAVVAARLSENADRRVLLLEAGEVFPTAADFPEQLLGLDENAWVGAEHNWQHALTLTRGRSDAFTATRGRVIGGSSSVNGGIHLRAQPGDFAGWGDGFWNWPEVLEAYRRSERDLDFGSDPVHGDRGPVVVQRAPRASYTTLYAAFDDACRSAGHSPCDDLNRPEAEGFGPLPRNFDQGRRVNSAVAYLYPALGRPNLEVRGNCIVDQVIVESGVARGVTTIEDGRRTEHRAGTVVLCAGALGSPAVLLRSGIGAAEQLAALGVAVRVELPGVGANLHDHPCVHVAVAPRADDLAPAAGAPGRLQSGLAFTASGSAYRNDLQIMPAYRMGEFALTVMLCRSTSAGTLRLDSTDPTVGARAELNYLSETADVEGLRSGVREAFALFAEPALDAVIAPGGRDRLPVDGSDDEVDAYVRASLLTLYHSCGTCAVGPAEAGGVVDGRGRVHGVEGLSVADVSILPIPLRANPNATSFMIGERFAEIHDSAVATGRPGSSAG